MRIAFIACAALLLATPTRAAPYLVRGEGNSSCGSWVEARKSEMAWLPMAAWMQGYITAYNEHVWTKSSDVAGGADADGVAAWLDTFCQQNPLLNLNSAADVLILEHK
jgi:hypothetical protein